MRKHRQRLCISLTFLVPAFLIDPRIFSYDVINILAVLLLLAIVLMVVAYILSL